MSNIDENPFLESLPITAECVAAQLEKLGAVDDATAERQIAAACNAGKSDTPRVDALVLWYYQDALALMPDGRLPEHRVKPSMQIAITQVKGIMQLARDLEKECARLREALTELDNIANAKRFDRDCFYDDTSFADWARNRAQDTAAKIRQALAPADKDGHA